MEPTPEGEVLRQLAPRTYQLLDWMMEADPLKDEEPSVLEHQTIGRLTSSASFLVKAAVGRYRHVFQRTREDPHLILPYLLGMGVYYVCLESHMRYDQENFGSMKLLATAYARLFDMLRIPFAVQAYAATLPQIEEFDPKTGLWKKRDSKNGHLHMATFHGGVDPKSWDAHELNLLSLQPQGFNLPFEGIPRCLSTARPQSQKAGVQPSNSKGKQFKFVFLLGNIQESNVAHYELKSTLDSYRSQGFTFLYFHVGTPLAGLHERRKREYLDLYDAVVDAQDLRQAFIKGLQHLAIFIMEKMGFICPEILDKKARG